MKPINTKTVGWTTIAAGLATLSIPFILAVLASGGSFDNVVALFGDILGAIATILIIPMLIAIGRTVMAKHRVLGRSIQIVGVLGALSDFTHYLFIMSGILAFEQAVVWNAVGRGLIGIAVLMFALLNRRNLELKRLYVLLSILLGVIMAPGVMGGGGPLDNAFETLAQGGTLAEVNPVVVVLLFIMAPGYLLGWPIWLIWTGRLFLKGKLAIPESNRPAPQIA
jgi:hypothetical protein